MQNVKGTSSKTMKLIKIKISRFKSLVTGILLSSGKQWSLVRLNVVDYVLDGYQFTNKKYVIYDVNINESTMLHKILSIKNRKEVLTPLERDNILDENILLFSYLKRKGILVAICLHREDILYVGIIKDVGQKCFLFDSYDTELQINGTMSIDYTKVRYIQMHTDYLDSLSLLLDKAF